MTHLEIHHIIMVVLQQQCDSAT